MKPMKQQAAKPMPVPAEAKKRAKPPVPMSMPVPARRGMANGGLVSKSHNPDNHISRMPGYGNGGMVGGKKKC